MERRAFVLKKKKKKKKQKKNRKEKSASPGSEIFEAMGSVHGWTQGYVSPLIY